jgi:prephenate dehydratase
MLILAYQGEPGAFSEQAAFALYGSRVRTQPLPTFAEVFRFAARSASHRGIIPIENSVFGSVHENYDLLVRNKLAIVGEVKLRIQLHLMAMPGVSLPQVHTIYSHPQALGQCEDFLRSLRSVDIVAHADTAGSAKMIREQERIDAAAIASVRAARTYGLRILKRNIENNHQNYTRFLVIAKRPIRPRGKAKTSLVFSLKNVPGALHRTLGVFAVRRINLLKIESRPLVGKPWEYLFYLDVEGSRHEDNVAAALKEVQAMSTSHRILGSYPVGPTIRG